MQLAICLFRMDVFEMLVFSIQSLMLGTYILMNHLCFLFVCFFFNSVDKGLLVLLIFEEPAFSFRV